MTNYKTLLVSLLAALVGLALLWIANGVDAIRGNPALQGILNNLGGAIITGVALMILWELVSKRSFAREVLENTKFANDIERSGVTRIGTNYLRDADWDVLFRQATKLDIFLAYGQTWRNNNHDNLRSLAARKKSRIRVYLPDPDDVGTVRNLAERFSLTEFQMIDRITQARKDFEALSKPGGADVFVYYRIGDSLFSAYRFDRTAIVTLYAHRRERGGVPTIVCSEPGSLYDFVREDIDAIQKQSRLVFPSTGEEESRSATLGSDR